MPRIATLRVVKFTQEIRLEPLNRDPQYRPMVFTSDKETEDFFVVGQFVAVVT